jgi:hypothetical protein
MNPFAPTPAGASPHLHLRTARQRAQRWLIALLSGSLLAIFGLWTLPTSAAEQLERLPTVSRFNSARFDLLTTLRVGDASEVAFGSGSTIMPDRVSMWIGTNDSDQLTYYVQVGTLVYTNDGSGWKRGDDLPPGSGESVTITGQLGELQDHADAILDMGDEPVRGIPTTHYQIWLSGQNLLDAIGNTGVLSDEEYELFSRSIYKVDIWVGEQDGLLHQQNTVLTIPAGEINDVAFPELELTTLITYYDLNDPSIAIEAPI